MPRPTKPTTSPTADFLARAIEFSGKTNREIAEEAGFARPNIISMLAQGQTKIPLNRIPALAQACHVDPVHMLRLAMSEYQPEAWEALAGTIGEPLTANELDLLIVYRMVAPNDEIETRADLCTALMELLLEFKERQEEDDH